MEIGRSQLTNHVQRSKFFAVISDKEGGGGEGVFAFKLKNLFNNN